MGGALSYIQIDSFIDSYADLKDYTKTADFSGVRNPVDGVIYPHICSSLPEAIRIEILVKIAAIIAREPQSVTMFIRRSPAGVPVPHIAHTDNSMGLYSLMLYMNDSLDGGTAFIRHKQTGMMYAPESQEFVDLAEKDQNELSAWAIVEQAIMKENRAVIFDAGLFHCAMPIGGFGEGAEARTVLTVFFS